jgi:hypothetical protein
LLIDYDGHEEVGLLLIREQREEVKLADRGLEYERYTRSTYRSVGAGWHWMEEKHDTLQQALLSQYTQIRPSLSCCGFLQEDFV